MRLEIPDEMYERIQSAASQAGLTPEAWMIRLVETFVEAESEAERQRFEAAAGYVMQKNAELYSRLAQGPPDDEHGQGAVAGVQQQHPAQQK